MTDLFTPDYTKAFERLTAADISEREASRLLDEWVAERQPCLDERAEREVYWREREAIVNEAIYAAHLASNPHASGGDMLRDDNAHRALMDWKHEFGECEVAECSNAVSDGMHYCNQHHRHL